VRYQLLFLCSIVSPEGERYEANRASLQLADLHC